MSPITQAEKCFVKQCTRPAGQTRGVCSTCYATAAKIVNRGLATWEELEEMKLVKRAKSAGHNPLRAAFDAHASRRAVATKTKATTKSSRTARR